jgi:hypothetical protein
MPLRQWKALASPLRHPHQLDILVQNSHYLSLLFLQITWLL